jgi:S-adenosylmethionine:diacylglycerol 3-amino-3-carboxypropyl transferase
MRRSSGGARVNSPTVWQAGRLDASRGPQRLLFGAMYEDAEIEHAAFQGKARVFCIASAGSTVVRLAAQHEVVACDINPFQLAYAERRAAGGPVERGDAERAMNFARVFMPLVGWTTRTVRAFLGLSDVSEQMAYWRKHLDTHRFRAALDALFSPAILRALYAPQLLASLPPRFGSVLRKRLETGFDRHPNASNPYARALLLGENDETTQTTMRNIRFVLADAASWLESCPVGSFDAFALSNILDGAEPGYRLRLSQAVCRAAAEAAVVVSRSFAEPPAELATNHAGRDRSMLWGIVDVRAAQALEDHPLASELPT